MASELSLNDPAQWSVEQVINNLCHTQITNWAGSGLNVPLPRPEEVETAFRENDIDGDVLLELEISDFENMKLRSIGQLHKLRRIIKFLRSTSGIYISRHGREFSASTMRTIEPAVSVQPANLRDSSEATVNNPQTLAISSLAAEPLAGNDSDTKSKQVAGTEKGFPVSNTQNSPLDDAENTLEENKSLLDVLSTNIEAQQSLNRTKSTVKRVVPTTLPFTSSKRHGESIEDSYPRKRVLANYPLETARNLSDMEHPEASSAIWSGDPTFQGGSVIAVANMNDPVSSLGGSEPPNVLSEDDLGPYQELLERWSAHDDDLVLPIYGESGDEDLEITDDSDSTEQEFLQSDTSSLLSKADVDAAIDHAIENFQLDWRSRKLIAAHKKACRTWAASRDRDDLRTQIVANARKSLDHIQTRLSRYRDMFHVSTWTKADDVERQCDSLQATIDQQQEYLHAISVLESSQPPEKLAFVPVKHAKQPRARDIEGEILCESDLDSLGDFVSDDIGASGASHSDVDARISASDAFDEPDLGQSTTGHPRHRSDTNSTNPALPVNQAVPVKSGEILPPVGLLNEPTVVTDTPMLDIADMEQPRTPQRSIALDTDAGYADDETGRLQSQPGHRNSSVRSRAAIEGRTRNPLPLPPPDSSDSDKSPSLDRSRGALRSRFGGHGKTPTEPILLTSSPNHSDGGSSSHNFEVRTPEVNPADLDPVDFKETKAHLQPASTYDEPSMPHVPKISEVRGVPWSLFEEKPAAHNLALVKTVSELDDDAAKALLSYALSLDLSSMEDIVKSGISVLRSDDNEAIEVPRAKQEIATLLTLAFLSYACVANLTVNPDDVSEGQCDLAWGFLSDNIGGFRHVLVHSLREKNNEPRKAALLERATSVDRISTDDNSLGILTEADSDIPTRSGRRRQSGSQSITNKAGASSATIALDTQRLAKRRVEQQQLRKTLINQKLARVAQQTGNIEPVPVNFKEPLVLLHPHIASKIKPHQKKGIEFIWRELIEDPQHQGCLLAHTMGLGKTMQVISVLVTIAQCLQSTDAKMREHIPPHLQDLRILVLSPPALCDNWYDELMFWMPEHDSLGPICKITNRSKHPYYDIKQWSESSGVLLIGYDRLVSYTKSPVRHRYDTDEQWATKVAQVDDLNRWLLQLPSLVVADEAHMLKNPTAKRAETAMQIRTMSRIALTGSPLSNHLEEYWAMINFIAPGYLDDIGKFRSKFVEPINRCLSSESSDYDRRLGLKKMHVLKKILDPKVNRADITALQSDMPSKTEFFITVPLTAIQLQMYKKCVDYFRGLSTETAGRGRNASLWQWISVLSLLCNHPWTFEKKIQDPQRKNKGRKSLNDNTEEYDGDDDIDISDQPAMLQAMHLALGTLPESLHLRFSGPDSPAFSYRMLLVKAIIQESLQLNDKLLIFSHSLLTLDYMEHMLDNLKCPFDRIDGAVATDKRQHASKAFNSGSSLAKAFLISTKAGGLGLNLFGANRVVILDYSFNPSWEEQAIGRAYRLGQKKPVFVYRFRSGGTFEDVTFNQTIFKTQMFTRIIDHKAVLRKGSKLDAAKYLFDAFVPDLEDFNESKGKDPQVMDKLIANFDCIRNIVLTETFAQDISEPLTELEIKEADKEIEDERLARTDPEAYQRRIAVRESQRYFPSERNKRLKDLQQSKALNPAERLAELINTTPSGSLILPTSSYQLPSSTPRYTFMKNGTSFDDSIVAGRSQPGNVDGSTEAPQSLSARQQGRKSMGNDDTRNCHTQ